MASSLLVMLPSCDPGPTAPPADDTLPVTDPPDHPAPQEPQFVPGRLLVHVDPGIVLAPPEGITLVREIAPGLWIVEVEDGSEESVAGALASNPSVLYAEPDYVRRLGDPPCTACPPPSDELFEWQWNMHNDGDINLGLGLLQPTGAPDADIDWLEAYELLGPSPAGAVRIAILDTGVRASHEDLCGKVVLQKNFYDGSANADDDHGHGTHVAGIAAACANNQGNGVVGVAYGPNMKLMAGKVCAADGTCEVSAIVEAIRWAADNGANVINMSFGDAEQSQAESDALQYAADRGVLMVCGAGNDGSSEVYYPAGDPNCVAVTATDWGDDLASYSTYGEEAELSAPGGDIESWLGLSFIASSWTGSDNAYSLSAGTSMAAPHVAGLGGLLHALGVGNAQAIRNCLRASADDLGPPGQDDRFGWGRINMHNAVLSAESCGQSGGNAPPLARFSATCSGGACAFDAMASADIDGTVVDYEWDFGDGQVGSGVVVTHAYASSGSYPVRLTVTDDEGAEGESTRFVSVGGMHVSDLEGWFESVNGTGWEASMSVLVVTSDGSPLADAQVSVSWSGGTSGSAVRTTGADGLALFRTASMPSTSSMTFVVVDVTHTSYGYHPGANSDADGDSDGTTLTLVAPSHAPTADFTWSCGEYDEQAGGYVCDFTDLSTDADGSIVSRYWDFGVYGSTPSTEQNPTNVYPYASGLVLDYLVSLIVEDNHGNLALALHFVTVGG